MQFVRTGTIIRSAYFSFLTRDKVIIRGVRHLVQRVRR